MKSIEKRLEEYGEISGEGSLNTKIHYETGRAIGACLRTILFSLFIVFLGLKIFKIITWSWWIIFSPILCFVIFVLVSLIEYFGTLLILKKAFKKKNKRIEE